MNSQYIKISKKEYALNALMIAGSILILGRLFYGSVIAGIVLLPLGIVIWKQRKKKICERKMKALEGQFKDMLVVISDALKTGYSIENAIRESYRDMLTAYGYDSDICTELRLMNSRIKLNVNVETIFEDFADRTDLNNARLFSRMISVAKKTGGSMNEIIRSVTDDIVMRQEVIEEIQVAIHAKKLEQKVMIIIPIFIVMYVGFTSPGFLDVMYETMLGKIVMTVCLISYIGAYLWSEKIVNIKV